MVTGIDASMDTIALKTGGAHGVGTHCPALGQWMPTGWARDEHMTFEVLTVHLNIQKAH